MSNTAHEPQPPATASQPQLPQRPQPDDIVEMVLADPDILAEIVSRAGPKEGRTDGWTPFARKLFLQVIAETGRVTLACEYAGLTKQSAYALRARDPLFAAGWDAACELARPLLADALYEKALDGVTETVIRNGEVVAERRRFDSRLSTAVLNRLDKRCDRAAELGSKHLALVRNWNEWLSLVGKGDEQAALAILEPAQQSQLGQLPESANPTGAVVPPCAAPSEYCWKDDEGVWMTIHAPPPGFDGRESGSWDGLAYYERACTPEEVELLDASEAAAEAEACAEEAEERATAEANRDAWFARLKEEIAACQALALGDGPPHIDPLSINANGTPRR